MKEFHNDVFGTIYEPQSFSELSTLLIRHTFDIQYSSNSTNNLFWRGQSNINWKVNHAAYRLLEKEVSSPSEDLIADYEIDLLRKSTERGFRNYHGKVLNDLELLARLQHHGAATRLMDFSRNMLVALWFAVKDNPNEHGLLIGVNSGGTMDSNMQLDGHSKGISSYTDILQLLSSKQSNYSWRPTNISNRIAAQYSQFLFSEVSEKKTGCLFLPEDKDLVNYLCINKNLKPEILEALNSLYGINEITLFPDFDGFCRTFSPGTGSYFNMDY